MTAIDEDAIVACADLIGRAGAKQFQIGYLHDDVPAEEAAWYAHAQLRGARIIAENHRGPTEAAEALARMVLTGAKCTHCGGLVALSDAGAVAYGGLMADGSTFTIEEAKAAGQCRWTRVGCRWERGCQRRTPQQRSTFQRRQPKKTSRRKRRSGRGDSDGS